MKLQFIKHLTNNSAFLLEFRTKIFNLKMKTLEVIVTIKSYIGTFGKVNELNTS